MPNRNITVGIFVLAGIVLFGLGIFMIGNQKDTFAQHLELYTEFTNLDGVAKGTKVQVAGMDAGEVVEVAIPGPPPSKFRVKMRIEERLHPLVRTDSLVTIATEGIVGDVFLNIHQGGAGTAEAAPLTTLPSKEAFDLAEFMDKSTNLLTEADGTMKDVDVTMKDADGMVRQLGGKLNGTLDAVTTTVRNTNDVVVGLKEGKGPAGLLLRDEKSAERIRQSLENAQQTTANLNAIVSDLQSRHLAQTAQETMAGAQDAVQNIDATSKTLNQTLADALGPDDMGVMASRDIRQSLSNINQATGNLTDETEAFKHNFFLRGFFKRRGYYNLTHLRADQYRRDKAFISAENHREWFTGADLFEPAPNGLETLSLAGRKRIDAFATQASDSMEGSAIVVEGYSGTQDRDDQFGLSRNRAILVSQYLRTHFHLNMQDVGMVSLRDQPPKGVEKDKWDGVCIVILK